MATSSKTSSSSSKTSSSSSSSSSSSKDSSKSTPESPKLPDKIDPNEYKDKVEHSGTIIIDGNKQDGFIVNGGAYDKDGNLLNNSWGNGKLDVAGGDYTAEYIPNGNNTGGTAIFNSNKKPETSKPSSGSSSSSSSYDDDDDYTPPSPPPPPPPKIEWTEPFPSFSANLKTIHKFTYFFGVDKLKARDVILNETSCFISEYINIGSLKEDEYIELDAVCDIGEYASIEFYILDGEMEIPIIPIKDTLIQNEKIFQGMPTRFEIDETVPYYISYNQSPSEVDLSTAMQKANGYTITYKPKSGYTYKPLNQDIKIKAILRSYTENKYAPRIISMKIRKYGGDALWS